MNREKLLKNMIDQLKEAQLKLGYAKETVRLYYPVDSLNGILGIKAEDAVKMRTLLMESFAEKTKLGVLSFRISAGRLEISIPPEGSEWVHKEVPTPRFLKSLIELFATRHACTLEEICRVFDETGKPYLCDKMPEGSDFDYAISFADKTFDEYYYCIHMEMGHTIYHRFMESDYKALL